MPVASTYIELPVEDSSGETSLSSTSAALIVTPAGTTGYSLSFDPSKIDAATAASVVNTFTAGEAISALQAVYQSGGTIFKADHDTLDGSNAVGVALTSGIAGASITVLQYGVLEDASFNFQPADLLFVSSDGIVSTIAPATGYLTRLGRAITTTSALIIIDSPKTL